MNISLFPVNRTRIVYSAETIEFNYYATTSLQNLRESETIMLFAEYFYIEFEGIFTKNVKEFCFFSLMRGEELGCEDLGEVRNDSTEVP